MKFLEENKELAAEYGEHFEIDFVKMNENVQRNIKNMAGRNYLSLVAFVPSMVTLFTQLSDKDYHNII